MFDLSKLTAWFHSSEVMALRLFGRIEIHRKATKVVTSCCTGVSLHKSGEEGEIFCTFFWGAHVKTHDSWCDFTKTHQRLSQTCIYSALMYFIGTEKQKPWDIEIIAQSSFYSFDPKLVGCREYPGRTHPGRRCKSILTLASFVLRCHLLQCTFPLCCHQLHRCYIVSIGRIILYTSFWTEHAPS